MSNTLTTTSTTRAADSTLMSTGHYTHYDLKALPPFPEDIPTAPLLTVSLRKLLSKDRDEINRFIKACEDLGFFYLDLTNSTGHSVVEDKTDTENSELLGEKLLRDADRLFTVNEQLFDLPLGEKKKYDFMHKMSYFGYKGFGANIDRDGNLDRNEFYNVSKDDIFELSERWPAPQVLEDQRSLIQSFMTSAHAIVSLVLKLLNDHLQLPPETLQNMHRLHGNSGDQVRFVKASPQPMDDRRVALGEHTDFGSVTVLFNRLGGLQVLPPGKNAEWSYVKPLQGHAIINLGDAMVKFTNGLLRSNIHRVVSPPGGQADATRYSLVYFARPENHILMKRLDGSSLIPALATNVTEEDITSKDWIIRRALGHRVAIHGQDTLDFDRVSGTEAISKRDNL